jgi:hypothetical protein
LDAVQVEVDKSLKLLGELFQNVAKSEKRLESAASARIVSGDLRKAQQPISITEELSRLHSDINMEIERMNLSTATGVEHLM